MILVTFPIRDVLLNFLFYILFDDGCLYSTVLCSMCFKTGI